jgi:formamidopyrimidine-DNA glycosylase
MPEAPELAVVREALERRLAGAMVQAARVLRPTVLRCLASDDLPGDAVGRRLEAVTRYGKTLTLRLSNDRYLVVVPMLTGRLHLVSPKDRVMKATFLGVTWSTGEELRYTDDRQMGMVYYAREEQLASIPRLEETGPDVLDAPMDLEAFSKALRSYQGEIKGVLTRGGLVAGIGNAYADEVLWAARVSPFKRRSELSAEEAARLHEAVYAVPREAVAVLRERMGEDVSLKPRDFLKVHNKGDSACPRCGGRISQITARQRTTSYCLRCQPGLTIRN